jgi:hypothetical protein
MKKVEGTSLRTKPCRCICDIDEFKSGYYYPMAHLAANEVMIFKPIGNHYESRVLLFYIYMQHFIDLPLATPSSEVLKLKALLSHRFKIDIDTYVAYSEGDDSIAYYYRLFDRFDGRMVYWGHILLRAEIHGFHENQYFSSEEVAIKHALKTAKHFLLRSYSKTNVLKSIFCGLDFNKNYANFINIHYEELNYL